MLKYSSASLYFNANHLKNLNLIVFVKPVPFSLFVFTLSCFCHDNKSYLNLKQKLQKMYESFVDCWQNISASFVSLFSAKNALHYSDVIMSAMVSKITSASIAYSTVCSGAEQRKHQSSTSLAFVRGIHWWPVNSLHKGLVTQKMFPFDYVIMYMFNFGLSFIDKTIWVSHWWVRTRKT